MTVYTLGVWRVRPGREEEFVAGWDELARWTVESGFEWSGTLLRDREQPALFVSVGPWPSAEVAERWRSSAGFTDRVARLRELVENVDEASVLDVVLRVS
jgi:heme-degrading monooxygenase HmoA